MGRTISSSQGAASRPSTRRNTHAPLKNPWPVSRCAPRTDRSHAYTSKLTVKDPSTGCARQVCLSSFSRRSEEHTSELQSPCNLVCRLLLEKEKRTGHLRTSRPLCTRWSSHNPRSHGH